MPFYTETGEEVQSTAIEVAGHLIPASQEPSTLGAAFGLFNTAGAAAQMLGRFGDARASGDNRRFRIRENLDAIAGYEEHASSFAYAYTMGDVAQVKMQIDRENLAWDVIGDAGANGIMSLLAAGILDPINLLGGAAFGNNIMSAGSKAIRMRRLAEAITITGATDAALQAQLETMAPEESVYNLAGSMFLAGILPVGFWKRFNKSGKIDQFNADMTVPPGGDPPIGRMQGGGTDVPEASQYRLKPFKGQRLLKNISGPQRIIQQSDDVESRKLATELFDFGMDIPDAADQAIETLIKVEMGEGQKVLTQMNRLYRKMTGDPNWDTEGLTVLAGKQMATRSRDAMRKWTGGKSDFNIPTWQEFMQDVGRAARRSSAAAPRTGRIEFPEIEEAAALIRTRLDDLGARGEASIPDFKRAAGYSPRIYNIANIVRNREAFVQRVARAFVRKHPEIELDDAIERTRAAAGNIINDPHFGAEFDGIKFQSSSDPTSSLRVTIPDSVLDGTYDGGINFLEDNMEIILAGYERRFVPELMFAEKFGLRAESVKKDALEGLEKRHSARMDESPGGDHAEALQEHFGQTSRDLNAGIDDLMNRYRLPGTPTGVTIGSARWLRAFRNQNTATKGGRFVISSFTDLGKPIMVHGLNRVWGKGIRAMTDKNAWEHIKLTQIESDTFGVGAEYFRAVSLFAIHDIDASKTTNALERGLSNAVTGILYNTGFANWNMGLKHFSAHVAQGRLVDVSTRLAQGLQLSVGDANFLSRLNITDAMARRISASFREFGEIIDGSPMSNVENWVDVDLQRQFITAVRKDVDTVIVTPGIADLPSMMLREGPMRTVLQFKSFALASMSRTMAVALQNPDADALSGLAMMVAMGEVVYISKELLKDEDHRFKHTDPVSLVYEAIDRSGAFGPAGDINNALQRITGNRLSVQRLFGSGGYGTRATRPNALGTLLGPSVDILQSGSVAAGALIDKAMTGEELTRYESGQLRRLIWWQNVWWTKIITDAAADALKGKE